MMFEQPWNIPAYDAESEKQSLDYRMKTQQVDWSEAPDWATCVVLNKTTNTFAWSDGSMYAPILRNPPQIMENADDFEIFEKRSCGPATPVKTNLLMTPKARGNTYEEFIATGWNDDQLVEHGYAIRTNEERMMKLEELLKKLHSEQGLIKKDFWYFQKDNGHVIQSFNVPCRINKDDVNFSGTAEKSIWKAEEICIDFKTNFLYGGDIINGITRPVGLCHPVKTITMTPDKRSWSPMTVGTETITPPSNCRCTFTPVQQPSTASDLLKQAEQLLTERGKQYDTSGQERSSAKIVAAFNTITGRDLTPGEGWLFLMLLKAVRFYSNTETPHRDSLEDLISYAALHAEEYLNDER